MALAALIFGANNRSEFSDPTTGKAVLTVDVTIRSQHSSNASISKRELEDGSQISDHMVVDPEMLVIEGVISETPLTFFNSIAQSAIGGGASLLSKTRGAGAAAAAGILGGALLGVINGSRAQNAYETMVSLQKQRILFDMVTGLKSYKNMALTSVVANRSREIGKAIQFSATMEEVIFATSQLITLSESQMLGNAGARATSSTNLGKQTTSAASDETSNNGSILFNIFENF